MVQKPGQEENVKRFRDKALGRRLQKSETSLQEGKVVYDYEKWRTDLSLLPGKVNKAWSTNQAKTQRVQRPKGKALSRKLWKLETSITCTITDRSIDNV